MEERSILTDLMTNRQSPEESERQCICGKICKNSKGLKIHMGRTKCKAKASGNKQASNEQCTDHEPGETVENVNPEENHSVQNLQVHDKQQSGKKDLQARREKIKWPRACDTGKWKTFDDDLEIILEDSLKGPAEKKVEKMTSLVHSTALETFGVYGRAGQKRREGNPNRRQRKIRELREKLRKTKKNWKMAPIEGKAALKQLRDTLRDKLKNIRKAEQKSALRKKKNKQRTAFISNPFSYTSQMLRQSTFGTLNCSQAELEDHLFQTHHDPCRGEELPPFEGLTSVHEAKCAFNLGPLQLKEVQEVVKKGRANSSPGPSGLAYAVYKRGPKLLSRLWKLLKAIWIHQRVPDEWNRAEGIYVPK